LRSFAVFSQTEQAMQQEQQQAQSKEGQPWKNWLEMIRHNFEELGNLPGIGSGQLIRVEPKCGWM